MIYEVGKFYNVPVAILGETYYRGFYPNSVIPLMGEQHNDIEIINVTSEHYHIDWRFVRNRNFAIATDTDYSEVIGLEHGIIIMPEHILRIETRRMKCKRDFRDYPSQIAPWFTKLQEKYAHTTAKNGRCPHKGFDMTTIKPDAEGCITCPLHGLKWNATAWKLQQ
ncbi:MULTISPECIES: Rieske 2Fe-2S domain-containing protein [unclassified Spirosoma]|uniref:Rieske 2Fe-2S domain-containing protein n=1 Tax=unclassified Spirosoma TaxID=2621999 RepID=UPI00096210CC|nr:MULTISPECIES: Rieske 2Fe-2S domain-containing protein [unclassified Spirosoma]MBN8826465.1 Rieske 2Fe-2S domain-containing protein [Spirosoma sp.]OJW76442.1 MAG: hypothetical protein BGO59_23295 [Spirosoma sp. 48-14]